jgi:amidophosphoribosyltransferase
LGGLFGAVSKSDCVTDLFFGVDYHSHLGTARGGMAVYNGHGFERAIHNIENAPFRTKFEKDLGEMAGHIGIGCISDTDPQPLIIRSHLGSYVIATVGRINNQDELVEQAFHQAGIHFLEGSNARINITELVASLINQGETIPDGIARAQEAIDGSMTLLVMTEKGIYAARDRMGRTPLILGEKEGAYCVSFESFAYLNLGYHKVRELGPGEIVLMTPEGIQVERPPREQMKICAFLWTYYGYSTSDYEGVNVEMMRYRCGKLLAQKDGKVNADYIAGVPDSGTAHAIGYANESGIPFARPFIKYTPTWPRSFMPQNQSMRNLVAHMKLIPVDSLIRGKKLLFIDDSIVRGTQTRETMEFLHKSGAGEVHIRSACPPVMYGCKYLNFSRSTSDMDLITWRTMAELEGQDVTREMTAEYAKTDSPCYCKMVEHICGKLKFTSLGYQTLENMLEAIGIDPERVCTYCWTGRE